MGAKGMTDSSGVRLLKSKLKFTEGSPLGLPKNCSR